MKDQTNLNPQAEATVLFTELTGFGRLSAATGGERASELYNAFFAEAEKIITLAGGRVDRYSGFCQLALFGLEMGVGKPVEKALGAALEIRDHFNEFLSEHQLENVSGIQMGMDTGPVVLTMVGSGEKKSLAALGEAVDKATRLKDLAAEGKILAGTQCYETGKDKFRFIALEPIPLHGKKEPLRIFELQSVKKTTIHTESARQVVSSMVGRTKEFDLLAQRVGHLLDGKGSVVTISGKAGIGKSRLMSELRNSEIIRKAVVYEGRALSTGQNLSFYPVIQILKSWAGIREEDTSPEAGRKLEHQIRRLFPQQAEEIFPFMATLMGYKLSGRSRERVEGIVGEPLEKLILKNLRDLIAHASSLRPIIIVIEDMHWADGSTISYLESLFKLVCSHRIMFVILMRPGYKDTGEHILNFLEEDLNDFCLNISIEPLTDSESGELIENLLHQTGLPENIRQLIIEKAEGNPFFIEEVIRNFIDDGVIEVKDNHFVVTDKIQTADVPATINEVIVSRIEKLDEKTKSLLKTASAIGRNFYYKVLQEATDTFSELDDKLEYLKDVQLINERGDKEEIEFLFKHALAQQATYESILLQSRKELHLKIARSIEKVFAEKINEFYSTLAYHYEKTGNKEKTEEYLLKAGDEAMKSAAHAEAISHYEKVLDLIHAPGRPEVSKQYETEIKEKLGYAYYAQGHTVKAADMFKQALAFYVGFEMPKKRIILMLKFAKALISLFLKIRFWNGKINESISSLAEQVLKLTVFQGEAIATFNPKETFIRSVLLINKFPLATIVSSFHGNVSLLNISVVFPWTGRGIKFGKMINNLANRVALQQANATIYRVLYVEAMFDYFSGQLNPKYETDKMLHFAMETGQVWAPTVYHSFKGIALAEMGMRKETEHLQRNYREVATALENTLTWVQFNRFRQTCNLKYRKLDEAIEEADKIISFNAKTDHAGILLLVLNFSSMACCFKRNLVRARQYLARAEEIAEKLYLKYYISITLLSRAYIELSEIGSLRNGIPKDKMNALLATSKSLLASSKKVNCMKTEAYRMRALAFQYNKQYAKALHYYNKAIEFATWYGARIELARTFFELGKFLSDPNIKPVQLNKFTGKDYLDKARSMFEEMDLQWDLAELRSYLAR